MTRDEAIKAYAETVGMDSTDEISSKWVKKRIDFYVAAGMLTLDKPKSAIEKFTETAKEVGYIHLFCPNDIKIVLNIANLEIVERKNDKG